MARVGFIFYYLLGFGGVGGFVKYIGREYFRCEQCGTGKTTDRYSYQNAQYIKDYIPKVWNALCTGCVKREVGKKRFANFRKNTD